MSATDDPSAFDATMEVPNDQFEIEDFQIELDCGLMATHIEEIDESSITVRASESLGYAQTTEEHQNRLNELQRGHPKDGDDRWMHFEDMTKIEGERVVDRVYAYQQFDFGCTVESISELETVLESL